MSKINENTKPIFTDLGDGVDEDQSPVTEVESYCMSCYKNGITKLILTKIPFYKDIIISSFECPHCFYRNNEVQSANRLSEKGITMNLTVKNEVDMNREVIKSDYANLKIPEIELEIPEKTQKAYLTTVEGILDRVIQNIEADMELKKDDVELVSALQAFLVKIKDLKKLQKPFHVIINDPSGESFIQNPNAPKKDENMAVSFYKRNLEQNEMLGLGEETEEENVDFHNEVVEFQTNCPNCNSVCETHMKLTDIPYFKTVVIMCSTCDVCGLRSSEVKSGSGISDKGKKYILKITDPSDTSRDILKSESASLEIPEIDFHVGVGTLGGKFTTIEGLLKDFRDQLEGPNSFCGGDSTDPSERIRMKEFLQQLEDVQNGKLLNVTVILDDPSGNSYLQNVYAPEPDPNLTEVEYERNDEQNDELGITDMKVENYTIEN